MYYLVFSSITYATWLQKRYLDGYPKLMHTPRGIPVNGCSHSLRCGKCDLKELLELAQQFNIPLLGVYKEEDGGFALATEEEME